MTKLWSLLFILFGLFFPIGMIRMGIFRLPLSYKLQKSSTGFWSNDMFWSRWDFVCKDSLLFIVSQRAWRDLFELGSFFFFHETSMEVGPWTVWNCRLVLISCNPSIVNKGKSEWVDFMHGSIFVYCANCGRVWHKSFLS